MASLPLAKDRYIESIRADSERFAAAVATRPTAAVQACPGWDNTALADHMGDVFNWAATQLRSGAAE